MSTSVDIGRNVAGPGSTQVNNVNLHTTYSVEEIDYACVHALQCPNTLQIKTRLKARDKLRHESISWILEDPNYLLWQNDHNVSLLWIRGGAGKGKTMMAIGLIETFANRREDTPIVAYFFCQNTEYELNTIEGIIKGLIFCLANHHKELGEPLRRRWNAAKGQFREDLTSWRTLWNVFLEMVDRVKGQTIYIVVDGLDECQDKDMTDFLHLVVRTGLGPRFKWLVTSRPLDSADRELLSAFDQVMVSLELNSEHVAHSVKQYVTARAYELDRRHKYGISLRQKVETKLVEKAEETFLWVSLVCKRLESVTRAHVLEAIKELPPGLISFYRRIFEELRRGETDVTKKCLRLLNTMMVVYRPLTEDEVSSVTGLSFEEDTVQDIVDRCASFVRKTGRSIEFVHQSAQDYLAGEIQSSVDSYGSYKHIDIALSSLSYLSEHLKVNLIDLPSFDSDKESMRDLKKEQAGSILASLDYAAMFWVNHVEDSEDCPLIRRALNEDGGVVSFLRTKLLEWLECMTLLGRLSHAIKVLRVLKEIGLREIGQAPSLLMLIQDAMQFSKRHYRTIANYPLQIWSSALIFSPRKSIIRQLNIEKAPKWLINLSQLEDTWSGTNRGFLHSSFCLCMTFSPDSTQIAVGTIARTIELWDGKSNNVEVVQTTHEEPIKAVAFSPDSKQIASVSRDTIWFRSATRGRPQKKLKDSLCLYPLEFMAFSPNGKHIASTSWSAIDLWDPMTGELQLTIRHLYDITAMTFSPEGKWIATGACDKTVQVWNVTTGTLQATLTGHSDSVNAVAFSPDSKQIASSSNDKTIRLWDVQEHDVPRALPGTGRRLWSFTFRKEIKMTTAVHRLRYSKGGLLFTDLGPISISDSVMDVRSSGSVLLEDLWIADGWVWYGMMRIVRTVSYFQPYFWDISGDRVAIRFSTGHFLSFTIDRARLAAELGVSASGLADPLNSKVSFGELA